MTWTGGTGWAVARGWTPMLLSTICTLRTLQLMEIILKKKHSHVFIHVTAGMNGLRGTLRVHCPLRGLTMDFQSIGITLKRQSYPFIHVIPFKRYFLQYTASFEDFRWISYPLESHSKTFACLFPCNPNLEVHFTVHCLLWGLWTK